METMHPAGRRTLPPVPRNSSEQAGAPRSEPAGEPPADDEALTERFEPALPEQAERPRRPQVPPPVQDDDPQTERFVVEHSDEPTDPEPTDPEPTASEQTVEPTTPEPTEDDGGPATERWVVSFTDEDAEPSPVASAVPPSAAPSGDGDPAQEFVSRLQSAAADFADAAGAASAVVRGAVPPARHRRARCRVILRYSDETVTDVTFLGPAGSPGRPSRHDFDRQIRRWFGSGQQHSEAWVVADPEAPERVAVDVTAWVAAG